jgi:hypothetical protein
MNEKDKAKEGFRQRNEIVEAFIGVGLLILLIGGFLMYKQTGIVQVFNDQDPSTEANTGTYESASLQGYIDNLNLIETNQNYKEEKDRLSKEMIGQLQLKSTPPNLNHKPFKISDTYATTTYRKDFLNKFSLATSSGMGLEVLYFISQIDIENQNLLTLSENDIKKMYEISTVYENFADKVQKIDTPAEYVEISEVTVEKSREVAFLLKQMMIETDPFVYAHLFAKYSEAASYIFREDTKNKKVKVNNI